MPAFTNPADIARETLKLLSARRIAPTPENYQTIYHEIAGTRPAAPQSRGDQALLKALQELAKQVPDMSSQFRALAKALGAGEQKAIESALSGLLLKPGAGSEAPWGELIRELMRQWELKQSGITAARKRDGLERVLSNFSRDSSLLFTKIQALVASWAENPVAQTGVPVEGGEAVAGAQDKTAIVPEAGAPAQEISTTDVPGALREMLAQTIQTGVAPRLSQFPDLRDEALLLAGRIREARDSSSIQGVAKNLKQFWIKLELRNDSDAQVLDGLVRLLRLLVDNISELLLDDPWLGGQIAVVQDIIAKPLDSRVLYDAERSFKEVIFKQGNLKHSLLEAKDTIKNMMATFIDRMSEMTASTGEYHAKIEKYTEEIGRTEDINKLNQILGNIMKDTRGMQLDMLRSRDELELAHKRVKAAEEKVRQLEKELDQVSELVHQDHLTGTLNRRGMDDAFQRELSRADRLNASLCVSLLDIDHFKRLNDTYGHETGDEALIHLVRVVKEALRPSDVVARFGGEEFVIILPDTGMDEAVNVMTRVQRHLTKNFFLHDNQRLLITFSAGVALRGPGENAESLISRADQALYQAKEAGRNRVVAAG
ncbi:MAG: diguanylate cyclase [Sulfuricella sp.]|nr:diguanylate cyclase [Sulfuricella sp.]